MIRSRTAPGRTRALLAASAALAGALLASFPGASVWSRGFHGFARPIDVGGGYANRFNDGGFGDGGFGSIHQSQLFSGWSRQGTTFQSAEPV